MLTRTKLFAVAVATAAFGLANHQASATVYNANLSGTVDLGFSTIAVGDPATLTVTYDDSIPNSGGSQLAGYFSLTLIQWALQMGSYAATATGGGLIVENDSLGIDRFGGEVQPSGTFAGTLSGPPLGGLPLFAMQFSLIDDNATVFNSVALPTVAPSISDFETKFFQVRFLTPEGFSPAAQATISSFTITPADAVPEPSTLGLIGLGLLGLGAMRRRRRIHCSNRSSR